MEELEQCDRPWRWPAGQLSAGKADGAQLGVKKDNGALSCVGHQAHRGGATDIKHGGQDEAVVRGP